MNDVFSNFLNYFVIYDIIDLSINSIFDFKAIDINYKKKFGFNKRFYIENKILESLKQIFRRSIFYSEFRIQFMLQSTIPIISIVSQFS